MALDLTFEETRVLGSLIEKDMATPEYYPMSLNALLNACNQKSNREPVVSYSEDDVLAAVDLLRGRNLVTVLTGGENRVPKYGHRASEILNFDNRELAIVCVLLLRGPQTVGELKTRTERLKPFDDLDSVEVVLRRLAERDTALQLPRQPGMREARWAHLMSGPIDVSAMVDHSAPAAAPITGARRDELADRVAKLEEEIAELKAAFAGFRKQFE